jgi:hypothetical protein
MPKTSNAVMADKLPSARKIRFDPFAHGPVHRHRLELVGGERISLHRRVTLLSWIRTAP